MADPTGLVTPTRPSRVHVTPITLWELGDLPRRVKENLLQVGLWLFMIGPYDIPQDPDRLVNFLWHARVQDEMVSFIHERTGEIYEVRESNFVDVFRFRSDAPPAERPWLWDHVLWPPIAIIGTDDTGALERNGFQTAMIHWSPLYMVARNFLSLIGAMNNLMHLYSRISDALSRGVLHERTMGFYRSSISVFDCYVLVGPHVTRHLFCNHGALTAGDVDQLLARRTDQSLPPIAVDVIRDLVRVDPTEEEDSEGELAQVLRLSRKAAERRPTVQEPPA
ncbi:hypothetical protein R1sor_009305 [Riccia sorocarpa]|uniref:Uncharacterized protein n=1 Tax=Riccia sorocarpa TaxID=122646 RepID=A0ABD3HWS7_9MARC